jgi:hypothetical protein
MHVLAMNTVSQLKYARKTQLLAINVALAVAGMICIHP